VNDAIVSFLTIMGQMTEISQKKQGVMQNSTWY